MQMIEGEFLLRKQAIPEIKGKRGETVEREAMTWFLNVWILLSALLERCRPD
jgi:hypothetical protein